MEPDVSVPRAMGANPQATPTADPVDEPAGVYIKVQAYHMRSHQTYSLAPRIISDLVSRRYVCRLTHSADRRPATFASARVNSYGAL